MTARSRIITAIVVAAVLWFIMFSPWTAPHVPFWGAMAASSCILLTLGFIFFPDWHKGLEFNLSQVLLGVAIAALMWGIFYLGDKLSSLMFSFARPQVDNIYALKDGSMKWLLAAQLLLLTGPAEEIFWRGCLQKAIGDMLESGTGRKRGRLTAALITLAAYTLIHIWSFNFMLVMAALVAGAVWGLLYYLKPQLLPALIVSHAIWDAAVFVVFPIM